MLLKPRHTLNCFACLLAGLLMLGCDTGHEPQELPRPKPQAEAPAADPPTSKAGEPVGPTVPVTTPETALATKPATDAETPKEVEPAQPSGSNAATAAPVNRKPLELSFDDIKFDIKPGDPFEPEMLPTNIEQKLGKRIRIRGYILPSFKQSGLTQFVLVRDNMECCFGPGAALYDCIRVEMIPGEATEFSIRPVAVEGIFRLDEFYGPDGKHLAIYHMTGEAVK